MYAKRPRLSSSPDLACREASCASTGDREACTTIELAHAFIPNVASNYFSAALLSTTVSQNHHNSPSRLSRVSLPFALTPHQTTPILTLDRRRTKRQGHRFETPMHTLLGRLLLTFMSLFQRTFRPSPRRRFVRSLTPELDVDG